MVCAWYMDERTAEDRTEPHMFNPPKFVDVKYLEKLGILYFQIFSDDYEKCEELAKLKHERNYKNEDYIVLSYPDTAEMLETVYKEHIHIDEEIRLCTEGSGYFDVRDLDDKWIRIELVVGDLLILPAGIYHHFSLDRNNYIKLLRYYTEMPRWEAFFRPAVDDESRLCRQAYLQTVQRA